MAGPCARTFLSILAPLALAFALFLSAGEAATTVPTTHQGVVALSASVGPEPPTTHSNALLLNFHQTPLSQVLNYFSDVAGFIIVTEIPLNDPITVVGTGPLDQDAAVNVLTAELNRHNFALLRAGRMLTITEKNGAKTRNLVVNTGNDPESIANTEALATWIIPIRFVEAESLLKDLSPFVSAQATVTANAAANSIVITDTQSNIRHLARLIQAVDQSAKSETEIRVFRLQHANPLEVESELNTAFGNNSGSGDNAALPVDFAGGEVNDAPLAGAGTTGGNTDRIKKATTVTVTADSRLQAVIVSAPKEMMLQIARTMDSLDVPSKRDQKVFVYHLDHGDPDQVVAVLNGLFQSGGTTGTATGSSQKSALQQRASTTATTSTTSGTSPGISSGSGGAPTGGGGSTTR